METPEVLARIKAHLEAIEPRIGHVYATLVSKFEFKDLAAETHFEDPTLGRLVKFFVVRPGEGAQRPHTTGRQGYALREREYVITGFVSVHEKAQTETILDRDIDAVVARLEGVSKLVDSGDTFIDGGFRFAPIEQTRIGETLCHFASVTLTVSDRRLRGG